MSIEKLEAQLATALNRIATLENDRGRPAQNQPQGIDPARFMQMLINDPMGTLKQLPGFTAEHLTHVKNAAIVDYLGPNAPMHMQMQANAGPQLIAAQQANTAVADLSRRFDEMTTAQKLTAKREEFKAISQLKDKYPHLSKAISANPDRYTAALAAHGGTAEEFASTQEGQLVELVKDLGVAPATTESVNSDNSGQSKEATSAPLASATNVVTTPSSSGNKVVWSKEAFQAAKAAALSASNTPR